MKRKKKIIRAGGTTLVSDGVDIVLRLDRSVADFIHRVAARASVTPSVVCNVILCIVIERDTARAPAGG